MHDPAKILLDLAITVALGGDCAADIALLRAQPEMFGLVASDPTVSRAIDTFAQADTAVLTAIRAARAGARAWVWHHAGAPTQNGWIVLDPDATILISHSEKEDATKTWKKTFGFHPLLVFCDHGESGTGEPVAGLLRRGNAGSNTAADHLTVLDQALAQIPAHLRQPNAAGKMKVLVRTDAAGATHAFTARIAGRDAAAGAFHPPVLPPAGPSTRRSDARVVTAAPRGDAGFASCPASPRPTGGCRSTSDTPTNSAGHRTALPAFLRRFMALMVVRVPYWEERRGKPTAKFPARQEVRVPVSPLDT